MNPKSISMIHKQLTTYFSKYFTVIGDFPLFVIKYSLSYKHLSRGHISS